MLTSVSMMKRQFRDIEPNDVTEAIEQTHQHLQRLEKHPTICDINGGLDND